MTTTRPARICSSTLTKKEMALDPLALLPPISTVLQSSEEVSLASESDSTFSAPSRRRRRPVMDESSSLVSLLSRFERLRGLDEFLVPEESDKKKRPSKRQRRSRKTLHARGFEGSSFDPGTAPP